MQRYHWTENQHYIPILVNLWILFETKKFTTFIVTNGTTPDVITHLTGNKLSAIHTICDRSHLQIKKIIAKYIDRKSRGHGILFKKLSDLLKDLSTRTVLRITAVNHLNIRDDLIDGYVEDYQTSEAQFCGY